MKKIFLLAIAVLGTSFAIQAQDTITIRYFEQDGSRFVVLYAESDNEQCVEAELQQVYGWNTTTGVLTFNGSDIPAFTGAQKTYWDGVFANSSLFVFPANANNSVTAAPIQGVTFN